MKKIFSLLSLMLIVSMPLFADEQGETSGSIARAQFTSNVLDREPVDDITELTNDTDKIYFFSDIRDMTGQVVIHRWEYNGNVMADVSIDVGGPRWRAYSSKNLLPSQTGEWKVSVVDGAGNVITEKTFNYVGANM
jgi:hypothetical protein